MVFYCVSLRDSERQCGMLDRTIAIEFGCELNGSHVGQRPARRDHIRRARG